MEISTCWQPDDENGKTSDLQNVNVWRRWDRNGTRIEYWAAIFDHARYGMVWMNDEGDVDGSWEITS